MNTKEKQRPSQSKPKDELARLIDRVNLVPGSVELPAPDFNLSEHYGFVDGYPYLRVPIVTNGVTKEVEEWVRATKKNLREKTKNFPSEFQKYIWWNDAEYDYRFNAPSFWILMHQPMEEGLMLEWLHVIRAASKYEEFYKLRAQFHQLVRHLEEVTLTSEQMKFLRSKIGKLTPRIANEIERLRIRHNEFGEKFPDSATLTIDEHGIMHITLSEFSRVMDNVEVTRIRRCKSKKCRKIFWAKRVESPCCSEVCLRRYHFERSLERAQVEGRDWRKEKNSKATERANRLLEEMGYNEALMTAYQKANGRHPRRLILGWLKDKLERKNISSLKGIGTYLEGLRLPSKIAQPLIEFISLKHDALNDSGLVTSKEG